MRQRVLNLLISLDQMLFSFITLGKAMPDETISAAAYRLELEGKPQGKIFRPLIDKLFFFETEHCKASFESEVFGKQLGDSYSKERERRK